MPGNQRGGAQCLHSPLAAISWLCGGNDGSRPQSCISGIDSEALIVMLKNLVAISNGSACTSSTYTPSHVIKAMGYNDDEANEAIRLSWCHLTPEVDWDELARRVRKML